MTIAMNLSAKAYSDPAIYELEREKIFRRSWQLIDSAAAVAKPGQYVATNIAGYQIFVIRGQDGILRGFQNVCPHRGAPILPIGSAGNCNHLKCPYHAAEFDDKGALAIQDLWFGLPVPPELRGLHLDPISAQVWRGYLFAAIAPVSSLEEQLGDLPEQVGNTPVENYTKVERRQVECTVNWKSYFDQYNEIWHSPQLHEGDKNVAIMDYRAVPMRNLIRMTTAPGEGAEAAYYGGKWMQCWPNWTFVLFPGGMKSVRINPLSATRIEAYHDFYYEDLSPAKEAERKRAADATLSIFGQDIGICERVLVNYSSGAYKSGIMHPQHEPALIEYHRRIQAALNS